MNDHAPNTFIVGAPKAGTSALVAYLAEHPNVLACDPKEPFFWCDDYPGLKQEIGIESLDDYLALFAEADPSVHAVRLEGSTRYLLSKRAIPRILEFYPSARIVVMLRNPIELVQAYHMEQLYSRHEDIEDFETAWQAQEDRALGRRIPRGCREPAFLQYGQVAKLGQQLRRVKRWVPADQLKVLLLDDLQRDTGSVYREALSFLDLPDDGRMEFPVVNAAHQHRYDWLAKLLLSPPARLERPILTVRRVLWEQRLPPVEWVKAWLNVPMSRPPLPDGLSDELARFFQEDVMLLGDVLQRDLSDWLH